jgi:hypothetical protein
VENGSALDRSGEAPTAQAPDIRRDHLFRALVSDCQDVVAPRGFQLDGRGSFDAAHWVRFERVGPVANKRAGVELLLLAHARPEQTLLADHYAVDKSLNLYVPRHKVLQRYDEGAPWAQTAGELIGAISQWW